MKAAIKEPKVKSDAKAKPFTTNVPVKCTVCEVDTFLWKYCIAAHFAMVHGGLGIPKDMGNVAVSERESQSLVN
jgi:hypothetical protein